MQCSTVQCVLCVLCVGAWVRECACAWRDLCDFVTSSCRMGIPTRCHFLRSSSVHRWLACGEALVAGAGGGLGSARLGTARLGSARPGSVRLRSARLGSARGGGRGGSASHAAGSEVVRDEFIVGLENTDQVVFLISVVVMVGRGACGGGGVGCAVKAACKTAERWVGRSVHVQIKWRAFEESVATKSAHAIKPKTHASRLARWPRAVGGGEAWSG